MLQHKSVQKNISKNIFVGYTYRLNTTLNNFNI